MMSVDEMIKALEGLGYKIEKRNLVTYDSGFMGLDSKGNIRMDSSNPGSDLEKLRLDAAKARGEMITTLDPNANSRNDESYAGKSIQALRDIASAHRDAYCGRLEGYC